MARAYPPAGKPTLFRPRRLPPRPPHRSGSRPSPPTGCLSTRRRGGSDGGTRERVASMTRWRASLRASLRTHVTISCVTRARVTPNPRFPLVISPIAPPTRARAAEAAVAAAAAARRARVASMTRRDAARHRALLRTPVRRPHASLARASSRTPIGFAGAVTDDINGFRSTLSTTNVGNCNVWKLVLFKHNSKER